MPSAVYGSRATSVRTPISGAASFTARIARHNQIVRIERLHSIFGGVDCGGVLGTARCRVCPGRGPAGLIDKQVDRPSRHAGKVAIGSSAPCPSVMNKGQIRSEGATLVSATRLRDQAATRVRRSRMDGKSQGFMCARSSAPRDARKAAWTRLPAPWLFWRGNEPTSAETSRADRQRPFAAGDRICFEKACTLLEQAGVQLISSHAVKDPNLLDDTVREAIASGAPMVIVGGGDGSLSSTVDDVVEKDCVYALLPLGTANSFARRWVFRSISRARSM
jgi:hypothetical protein